MSEAEYGYLASLLRKARKDTREEEIAQEEEALILAEQIALLRKESRRVAKPESG